MRHRGRKIGWAALLALAAGLIVAYANPAPPIENAATADAVAAGREADRLATTLERDTLVSTESPAAGRAL